MINVNTTKHFYVSVVDGSKVGLLAGPFATHERGLTMRGIEVTFSRVKAANWPWLHAARVGAERTLCGIGITVDWAYDSDCSAGDVECKRCCKVLSGAHTHRGD